MSKGAQVLQNAIEVECHDIIRGVDGRTSGCLFHGDEAELLIDAAVAPLVNALDTFARQGCELEQPKPCGWCNNCTAQKALDQWRAGR